MTDRLAGRASRGAAVTLGAQGLRVLVQTASVVVLARLLAPTDYGLIAEVLVVIGLGEIFRDFGLTSAAVQAKTLSAGERSNLFWLNAVIGVVLAAVTVLAAPGVAAFYGDDRLVALTAVLSVVFLFNGVGTQLRADLNRRLAFGRLSAAEIVGQAAGLAGGVAIALLGGGYWALAGQQILQAVVTLVLLWWFDRFRPERYRRDVPMRRFLGFGADVVGAQLLGYAGKNTDTVVIGATLGVGPLGVYNRAFQLLALPLTQINAPATRVALPVLSSLQDQPERFRRYLLAGQSVMLHLVLAVFSWSTALATPLLLLLLGPRWSDSVPLFQILAVSGVFTTAGYSTYWVFMAKGLTRSFLFWQIVTRPVVIGVVLLGALGGLTGVAIAYSSVSVLTWVLGLVWIARVSDAPARAMLVGGILATTGYLIPAAAAWAVGTAIGPGILGLVGGTVAWVAALAAVLAVWPAFRRDALVVLRVGAAMRGARGRSERAPVQQAVPR
ncbi:lipopolysaccharide biosynthesis protein [Amnibacterium setariae]|uniref:lipopolysaccharide biosynthesis protein n=1 Tax=Amnibacterium setariae TaxID=2306585 RepID=UPI001314683E|nr:lipopolysaccharide biosynthesis protein [Amnibacterium setariae]